MVYHNHHPSPVIRAYIWYLILTWPNRTHTNKQARVSLTCSTLNLESHPIWCYGTMQSFTLDLPSFFLTFHWLMFHLFYFTGLQFCIYLVEKQNHLQILIWIFWNLWHFLALPAIFTRSFYPAYLCFPSVFNLPYTDTVTAWSLSAGKKKEGEGVVENDSMTKWHSSGIKRKRGTENDRRSIIRARRGE